MSDNTLPIPMKKRQKKGAPKRPMFMVQLDSEDRAMLEEASRAEKLTRSDIIRRALRAYYRKLRSADKIAS
jgi:metal-responsive CopG/Arc/MetJ family transcriptional regulator